MTLSYVLTGLMSGQVFPDWFADKTQAYWTEALRNWSDLGLNYSGIWLDVNEPSSYCVGSW